MLDEVVSVSFIERVGVPVVAFMLMYVLYVHTQKWQQKQQEQANERFDKLVNLFISTVKEITDTYNTTIEKHTNALEKNTAKLEEQTAKLDEHVRQKDSFMEFIKDERRSNG